MLIVYLKDTKQLLQRITGDPVTSEKDNNKLYLGEKVLINDLSKVSYGYYEDAEFTPEIEIINGMPVEKPVIVDTSKLKSAIDYKAQWKSGTQSQKIAILGKILKLE